MFIGRDRQPASRRPTSRTCVDHVAHSVAGAHGASPRHGHRIRPSQYPLPPHAQRKVRMTRVSRMFVPLALSGLLAGGIVVACHHSEAPTAPRPDPVAPGGQPASGLGPSDHVGNSLGDAGTAVDASISPPPGSSALSPRFPSVRSRDGRAPSVLLAAQPTGGAPSPGTTSPGTTSGGTTSPGGTQPGGTQPGAPLPSPAPGAGSGTGSSSPGVPGTSGPSDAGVSDSYTPPVRPASDARSASDSQVTPILQRD